MSSNPLMMCYKGNRRSGVALAMRHRLSGLSTYGLKGQCAGDEHPTYDPSQHGPFTLPTPVRSGSPAAEPLETLPVSQAEQ